ncbi:PREDICTED: aspartic proteinase-like protein 1 isoform X2 [Lupinus angustifolius]|uniref:aspartic proteinase-like protein 1 isoform X2 n=1 Tax=Lupinus angustifolius TaxID=3871 RepID=UPI00092E4075|nr:PREDICTED: aspartic proteinase-like protein 1 isoform X2 [Lupinus angustifolius]
MAINFFIFLLLANGLAFDGVDALTFSSKLIHRFSDEAKVHLASKGDSVWVQSWPKRNSSEYLRLLLSSDMTRQRMRLVSQYDSLYPSEGSNTFSYGEVLVWLHYTWIDIGTPNVSFLVALDTGSDLLWVPCDCIECASLSAVYYNVLDKDLNEYSPSLSNTSRHLPCSHQLCDSSSNCKGPKDPCPYEVQYTSANTSTSGFLIEDRLNLAPGGRNATQSSVQASIVLGCGRKQSGSYLHGAAPDGVLGLGPGSISVPSLVAKAGLIPNSFSICLTENDSGRILFGDQGHINQRSTPFLPVDGKFFKYVVGVESICVRSICLKQTGFQTLIDTGTSFTYLPGEVYKKVVAEFDKHVNATRITDEENPWEYCYNASSQELNNFPEMKFTFSKNQTFLIQNPMLNSPVSQEYTAFCLTLLQTVEDYGTIGQDFLKGYRMVFDRENLQFGWSSSNCQDIMGDRANFTSPSHGGSSNPLSANQQQTIPNTSTIPPAIAGKASSKPFAATTSRFTSLHLLSSVSLICHFFFNGNLVKAY